MAAAAHNNARPGEVKRSECPPLVCSPGRRGPLSCGQAADANTRGRAGVGCSGLRSSSNFGPAVAHQPPGPRWITSSSGENGDHGTVGVRPTVRPGGSCRAQEPTVMKLIRPLTPSQQRGIDTTRRGQGRVANETQPRNVRWVPRERRWKKCAAVRVSTR